MDEPSLKVLNLSLPQSIQWTLVHNGWTRLLVLLLRVYMDWAKTASPSLNAPRSVNSPSVSRIYMSDPECVTFPVTSC